MSTKYGGELNLCAPGNVHCISLCARDGIIDRLEWTEVDVPQIKVREQA